MKSHQKSGIGMAAVAAVGCVVIIADWDELTLMNTTGVVAAIVFFTLAVFILGILLALRQEDL